MTGANEGRAVVVCDSSEEGREAPEPFWRLRAHLAERKPIAFS